MTTPTAGGDRARRLTVIGLLLAGGTATVVLTAAGLWLITAGPATPVTPPPTASKTTTPPTAQIQPTSAPTHTAGEPKPSASPSAATSTGQGDPMAGAITDALIQQTLDEAGLTTVDAATAKATRVVAWKALAADLQAGGWRRPHLQGSSVAAPGNDQTAPAVVDVTAIWSATSPAGDLVDRQRSIVRLTSTQGRWAVDRIT